MRPQLMLKQAELWQHIPITRNTMHQKLSALHTGPGWQLWLNLVLWHGAPCPSARFRRRLQLFLAEAAGFTSTELVSRTLPTRSSKPLKRLRNFARTSFHGLEPTGIADFTFKQATTFLTAVYQAGGFLPA